MSINFLKPDGTMGGGLSFGNGMPGSYGYMPSIPNLPNLANDTRGYEVTPNNQYVQIPNIQSFIDQYRPQAEKLYEQYKPEVTSLLERLKTLKLPEINTLNTNRASAPSTSSINPAKQTAINTLMSRQRASDRLRKNKVKEDMMRFQNAQQLTRTTDETQADTNKLQADLMAKLYR